MPNKSISAKTAEKLKVRRLFNTFNNRKKSTPNALLFDRLYEDGLMHIGEDYYSKTYSLGDIFYSAAKQDIQMGIWQKYTDALNLLTSDEAYQLTFMSHKIEKSEFQEDVNYKMRGDGFDDSREEFNSIANKVYDDGQSNFAIKKYVTIRSIGKDVANARRKVNAAFINFDKEISETGAKLIELDGQERAELFAKVLRPGTPIRNIFDEMRLMAKYGSMKNISVRDFIAPWFFKLNRSTIEINDKIGKVMFLRGYPTDMSDNFIKEILEISHELVVSIYGRPFSIGDTNKMLSQKATAIDSEIISEQMEATKNGYSPFMTGRKNRQAQKEVDEIINTVRDTGDKLWSSIFTVFFAGNDMEELELVKNDVIQVAQKFSCTFEEAPFMQDYALSSVLPFGMNYLDVEQSYMRKLTTSNISINVPFTNVDLRHNHGKYYGVNLLTQNVISVNRQDESLTTPSGLVFGKSGSGKSMTVKSELISTRLQYPEDEIIIVDPEAEYSDVVTHYGGQVVTISAKSQTNINLLDLPAADSLDDGDDPIALKANFLMSLFSTVLDGLNSVHMSLIDKVTQETYSSHQMPTLVEWWEIMSQHPEPEAKALAKALDLYVHGSLDMFAHKTNVELNKSMISFNFNKIGDDYFKPFAFMVVADKIWNRITENRRKGIRTWVYFDEIQLLFGDDDVRARQFFAMLWSRVRKYGGIPTGITQVPETILSTKEGRAIFENSDFGIFLAQKSEEVIKSLTSLLNLSPQLARYLKTPPPHCGLLMAGNVIVPFGNPIPKYTKLFEIMNTDVSKKFQEKIAS